MCIVRADARPTTDIALRSALEETSASLQAIPIELRRRLGGALRDLGHAVGARDEVRSQGLVDVGEIIARNDRVEVYE